MSFVFNDIWGAEANKEEVAGNDFGLSGWICAECFEESHPDCVSSHSPVKILTADVYFLNLLKLSHQFFFVF